VQPDWFLPVHRVERTDYVRLRPLLYPVPGVVFRVEDQRAPAFGELGAELIGTTGPITAELLEALGPPYDASATVGRSGLERSFERFLAGEPGAAIVKVAVSGDETPGHTFPGAPAQALATSLSLQAQAAAEATLADLDMPASLVAIDAATGEIRAAVSTPRGGFNESLSGLYPPGSTIKIVVATALLESGVQPDDQLACPEVVTVAGKEFRNATRLPTTLTLVQAFARSCNTAFIQAGLGLDPAQLALVADIYGFDRPLDVGLEAAAGTFGASDDPVEQAAAMIGQGRALASPLQMASVAATVASGEHHEPTFVVRGGSVAARLEEGVAADLRTMMQAVVSQGTGRKAALDDRVVAGKTGTAQIGSGDGADTVAWFVGYSDGLAFAVAVDGGSSGGDVAAPLIRRFLLALDEPFEAGGSVDCVPAGQDWPTFQGTSHRSGCSEAEALQDPVVAWQAEAGIQAWLNSPVVADGLVIVGSAGNSRAAPDVADGIYALDLERGTLEWQFPTGNDVNGVAVSDGLVVAGGDEGAVWGIDTATGTELWRLDTGSGVFGYPAFTASGVVVGDASGTLHGIGRDGSTRWTVELDGAIRGGAASDGDLVYAVSEFGEVVAADHNGFVIWNSRVSPDEADGQIIVYAAPTIVDDLLVVTYTVGGGPGRPGIVGFDRYVGEVTWHGSDPKALAPVPWANVRSSVAAAGSQLILASSSSNGPQAAAVSSGAALWWGESPVRCERQWASPIVMDDLVVLPRPDGAVYGYAVSDGSMLWRVPLRLDPAAIASGCVDDTGQAYSEAPEIQASAAVAPDGTVIVASTGRGIFAIRSGD